MNILINIPDINKTNGGVYQYSIALLKILAKAKSTSQIFIYCNDPNEDILNIINSNRNFKLTNCSAPNYSLLTNLFFKAINTFFNILKMKKGLKRKDIYDVIIKCYKIDIIHSPLQKIVVKKNIKNISTMHDVQELYFPEFFTSEQRAYRAVNYKKAIDKADAVIVSYDHIKKDIIKYFDKKESQVYTILLDMEDLWFTNITKRDEKILNNYDLPKEFLLYPASTWEHKNHLMLLKAIKNINNESINLVCTGHKTDYFTKEIEPFIISNKLENKIKFLGIVSDFELFELYKSCKAVIVPTLYEAGSFPLMESILMSVPVICSNTTSLPETIGNRSFVFDPFDVDDIINKINKIWFDKVFIQDNLELLKIQAEKLKNNNAFSKIYKVYEDLMN